DGVEAAFAKEALSCLGDQLACPLFLPLAKPHVSIRSRSFQTWSKLRLSIILSRSPNKVPPGSRRRDAREPRAFDKANRRARGLREPVTFTALRAGVRRPSTATEGLVVKAWQRRSEVPRAHRFSGQGGRRERGRGGLVRASFTAVVADSVLAVPHAPARRLWR